MASVSHAPLPTRNAPPAEIPAPTIIPDWIRSGTSELALKLADHISVFCQNDQVILRLHGRTEGEIVEFEVHPDAFPKSLSLEQQYAKSFDEELSETELLASKTFKRFAADPAFTIKKLNASLSNNIIEGTLAENAVVSGSLSNCIVSLRGSSARFENFSITGSTPAELECPHAMFRNVTIDDQVGLLGELSGLRVEGKGTRIKAYATALKLSSASSTEEPLATVFQGALLSNSLANKDLFSGEAKELTKAELGAKQKDLNLGFARSHFSQHSVQCVREHGEQVLRVPMVLRNIDSVQVSCSLTPQNTLRLELSLPVSGSTSPSGHELPAPTLVITLPFNDQATVATPATAFHLTTEDEASKRIVSADVGTDFLSEDFSLAQYSLWFALGLSRGRGFERLRALLTLAQGQKFEVQRTAPR